MRPTRERRGTDVLMDIDLNQSHIVARVYILLCAFGYATASRGYPSIIVCAGGCGDEGYRLTGKKFQTQNRTRVQYNGHIGITGRPRRHYIIYILSFFSWS